MSQVTYTVLVKVNGTTLQGTSVGIKFGGFSRELKTAAGVAGRHFVRVPVPGGLTVNVLHNEDGPTIEEMKNWENVTLVAESDNGLVYQMDGAKVLNALELGDEGKGIDLEFGGPPFTQV